MTGWGETHGAQYIRFVFANEPIQRLELLGARVRKALSMKTQHAADVYMERTSPPSTRIREPVM